MQYHAVSRFIFLITSEGILRDQVSIPEGAMAVRKVWQCQGASARDVRTPRVARRTAPDPA